MTVSDASVKPSVRVTIRPHDDRVDSRPGQQSECDSVQSIPAGFRALLESDLRVQPPHRLLDDPRPRGMAVKEALLLASRRVELSRCEPVDCELGDEWHDTVTPHRIVAVRRQKDLAPPPAIVTSPPDGRFDAPAEPGRQFASGQPVRLASCATDLQETRALQRQVSGRDKTLQARTHKTAQQR